MIQRLSRDMQQQNEMIQRLSQKKARLEKLDDNDAGSGTMYYRPEEVFRNEKVTAHARSLRKSSDGLSCARLSPSPELPEQQYLQPLDSENAQNVVGERVGMIGRDTYDDVDSATYEARPHDWIA